MTAVDLNLGVIIKGDETTAAKTEAIKVKITKGFRHWYKSNIIFPELDRDALLMVI